MTATTVETRQVLAGAYKGKSLEERALLTHSLAEGAEKTLCGRILEERLADAGAGEPDAAPTCAACLKRDPRFSFKLPPTRPSTKTAAELIAEVEALAAPGALPWERDTSD